MTDKFKCIECGDNEVDDECDICDDCLYNEEDEIEDDEE